MIRSLLIFVFIVVVYYALKTLFRSAVKSYHEEDQKRTRIMGEDMVQDPECHTYVPKGRAVTRHIGGRLRYFCSEACANQYEEKNRA
jgi:YHS domain-containing protein